MGKPTRCLTRSQAVAQGLKRECPRTHEHRPIRGQTLVDGKRMLLSQFAGGYAKDVQDPVRIHANPVIAAKDVFNSR